MRYNNNISRLLAAQQQRQSFTKNLVMFFRNTCSLAFISAKCCGRSLMTSAL